MPEGKGKNRDGHTCVLIGSGTLPVACATILREAGMDIIRTFSIDGPLRSWAHSNQIPHQELTPESILVLADTTYDLLFSVVTPLILPTNVLRSPRIGAYNYHDAPLPRYAGVHATSWAIINQESQHGISWHEMADKVDAGDIACFEPVSIDPAMTALALNVSCYHAAVNGFQKLVEKIAHDGVQPSPQNLNRRTYFGRYKRPAAACTIDWNSSSKEISALVRGLHFGPYPNPLGSAKMFTGREFLLVTRCSIVEPLESGAEPRSHPIPGTITRLTSADMHIATATGEVKLEGLKTLAGDPVDMKILSERFLFSEGEVAPSLRPEDGEAIDRLVAATARHEAFWVERLASVSPVSLPALISVTENGRSTQRGASVLHQAIPPVVKQFAAQTRQTVDETVIAAFAAFIGLCSGQQSFDLAWSRDQLVEDADVSSALFAAQVPFRYSWIERDTISDALEKIRAERALMVEKGTYQCDVVTRYPGQIIRSERLPVGISTVGAPHTGGAPASHALLIRVEPHMGEVRWVVDPGRVDLDRLEAMVADFEAFLQAIVSHPERPLGLFKSCISADSIRKPTDSERVLQSGLDVACGAGAPGQDLPCVHVAFEQQADRYPDEVALRFNDAIITFGALNARANQIACRLRRMGIGPDVPVGICLDRSTEMIVCVLAVLKAGAAYVPIDPLFPVDRIRFVVTDAGMPVVVTHSGYADRFQSKPTSLFLVDEEDVSGEPTENLRVDVKPENLIYLTYTSGSTGRPKGVAMPHGPISNLIDWQIKTSTLGPGSVTVQYAALIFDASASEIFSSLCSGGELLLIEEHLRYNVVALLALLVRRSATRITLSAVLLAMLCETAEDLNLSPDTLRDVISTGEQLKITRPIRLFFERLPKCRLRNEYGPSEAHTVAAYTLPEDVDSWPVLPPVGNALPYVDLYILDADLNPVVGGSEGELYVGGRALARGYHNRPDLTTDRFIPDPFSVHPGARLYRTGDTCRYTLGGMIEFVGRKDDQIQLRGARIELGEIESKLAEHEAVRQCAAVIVGEPGQHDRLVSFLVERQPVDDADLRQFLGERLPGYMVPVLFVRIPTLPYLPNGKVDRLALRSSWKTESGKRIWEKVHTVRDEPRSDTERLLLGIWSDILGREDIDRSDNLFDLGGDSLSAMRIINRINALKGIDLPLKSLFEASTIAAQAEVVDRRSRLS